MTTLVSIEGVGDVLAKKLIEAGVRTAEALLDKGATSKGRKALAEASGISEKSILEWVNRVDLARIKGVGSEFSDLLEAVGVDTVPELSHRVPENLLAKMVAVNTEKKLVRRLPTLNQVTDWVAQAKALPRVVEY